MVILFSQNNRGNFCLPGRGKMLFRHDLKTGNSGPSLFFLVLLTIAIHCSVSFAEEVVLKYRGDAGKPIERISLSLLPPDQRQAILGKLHLGNEWLRAHIGLPRPGVASEEVNLSLELARYELAWLDEQIKRLDEKDQTEAGVFWGTYGLLCAPILRILSVAGDLTDAQRLLEFSPRLFPHLARDRMAVAGYIEARLGTIEQGELVKQLNGPDLLRKVSAAIILRDYGINAGEKILIDDVREGDEKNPKHGGLDYFAAYALFNAKGEKALEAFRHFLHRGLKFAPSNGEGEFSTTLTEPAFGYLLANGTPTDVASVSTLIIRYGHFPLISYLVEDPIPLLKIILRRDGLLGLAQDLSVLRTLSPDSARESYDNLIDAAFRHGSLQSGAFLGNEKPELKGEAAANRFRLFASWYQPDLLVAQGFYNRQVNMPEIPWIPICAWSPDTIVQGFLQQTLVYGVEKFLDHISPANLRKIAEEKSKELNPVWLEIFLRSQALTSRVGLVEFDSYADGREHRPYVLGTPEKNDGALSGVIHVLPELTDRKLRLQVKLDQAHYFHRGDFIHGSMADKEFDGYAYSQNGGTKSIHAVRVFQGNHEVPVTDKGIGENQELLFEANLDKPDFSGVYAVFEMDFFEAQAPIVFDLFASDAARNFRRQRTP